MGYHLPPPHAQLNVHRIMALLMFILKYSLRIANRTNNRSFINFGYWYATHKTYTTYQRWLTLRIFKYRMQV